MNVAFHGAFLISTEMVYLNFDFESGAIPAPHQLAADFNLMYYLIPTSVVTENEREQSREQSKERERER